MRIFQYLFCKDGVAVDIGECMAELGEVEWEREMCTGLSDCEAEDLIEHVASANFSGNAEGEGELIPVGGPPLARVKRQGGGGALLDRLKLRGVRLVKVTV